MATLYEHAGGEAGLHRFIDIFFRNVLGDPLLHPLFGEGRPEQSSELGFERLWMTPTVKEKPQVAPLPPDPRIFTYFFRLRYCY